MQKEESTEPIHHLIHRIMSTSSYNQEDLGSPARYGDTEQQAEPRGSGRGERGLSPGLPWGRLPPGLPQGVSERPPLPT